MCPIGLSVFQPDHTVIQGVSAFWMNHIYLEVFGYDLLPELSCCSIDVEVEIEDTEHRRYRQE